MTDKLTEKALARDKRSIARLISFVESGDEAAADVMRKLYPRTGRAHILGVTGSPGAGKSTLVGRVISRLRAKGLTVAVIAVDPSSPYTGGAILGDRLRMQEHSLDEGVFIRSMGSRGNLGGVSNATHEASLIFDACGVDVVLIETVGVGQSEIDIVKIADTVCLILVPGMGDDVQIMKAGIMEIADLFAVNKSDRDGADKVAADVRVMLDLAPAREWRPPVSLVSAERDSGIEDLIANVEKHVEYLRSSGEGERRRRARAESEVEGLLRNRIAHCAQRLWHEKSDRTLDDLAARRTDPYTVASDIMSSLNLV